MTTLLEVDSLGARAGSRWIVERVTFQARAGEITAVIGPNGAGKTTLLETIAGLRPTDAGEVRVSGRPLLRFADRARSFSYLPDAGVLPPETSVRTLVEHAKKRASRKGALDALVEDLRIAPLLPQTVALLSRGEHQRVGLFCALAAGRPIALLDEPFSAFDPLQLRNVLSVVRELAKTPMAIVASIHQLADAEKIADKILLLADGKPIAFGDPASLRARTGKDSASLEEVFVSLLSESGHAT